jgi:hypothetical protein
MSKGVAVGEATQSDPSLKEIYQLETRQPQRKDISYQK